MEIRKRFDSRRIFIFVSIAVAIIYMAIGLQPAEATNYNISTSLSIPAIGLESGVAELGLRDGRLDTPATIVGSYTKAKNKTLLVGHSTTVFVDLDRLRLGDAIYYNNEEYRAVEIQRIPKAQIHMNEVLAPREKETLVIMTCAGELYRNGDASHRLMVVATQ